MQIYVTRKAADYCVQLEMNDLHRRIGSSIEPNDVECKHDFSRGAIVMLCKVTVSVGRQHNAMNVCVTLHNAAMRDDDDNDIISTKRA